MMRIGQKGETIVEVLIAVVVLSSALGGAFAIANRSQSTIQANNERYQAQLIANQQADLLRAFVTQGSTQRTQTTTGNFCLSASGSGITRVSNPSATSFDPSCIRNTLYEINITNTTSPVSPIFDIYKIKITWDSVINGQEDTVELYYGT